MERLWMLFLLSSLFSLLTASEYIDYVDPPVYYFDGLDHDNRCSMQLERRIEGKNGILVSHTHYEISKYNGSRDCFIMIAAPIGYRVRLRLMHFDVNGRSPECEQDALHVFDHAIPVDPKQPHRATDEAIAPGAELGKWCGNIKNTSELVVSSKNVMTIWWHTAKDLQPTHPARGFKILWSAFRKETTRAPCSGNREFKCDNSECIPSSLACNSYADCSDDSDLNPIRQKASQCSNVYVEPSAVSGAQMFLVLTVLLLASALICVCVCLLASRQTHDCHINSEKHLAQQQSPHKEYTPATEDTATSSVGREGRALMLHPQPPTFYPPSPPYLALSSNMQSTGQTSNARVVDGPRSSLRKLHHTSHFPVHYVDDHKSPTRSAHLSSNYYHRFIPNAYPMGAVDEISSECTSSLYGSHMIDPPPTVCDSDYTYVRAPVDSRII